MVFLSPGSRCRKYDSSSAESQTTESLSRLSAFLDCHPYVCESTPLTKKYLEMVYINKRWEGHFENGIADPAKCPFPLKTVQFPYCQNGEFKRFLCSKLRHSTATRCILTTLSCACSEADD